MYGDGSTFMVIDFVDLILEHNHPKDYVRQVFSSMERRKEIVRTGFAKPPRGGTKMPVFKLTKLNLKAFKPGIKPAEKPLNPDEFNTACSKRLNEALNAAFKPNN